MPNLLRHCLLLLLLPGLLLSHGGSWSVCFCDAPGQCGPVAAGDVEVTGCSDGGGSCCEKGSPVDSEGSSWTVACDGCRHIDVVGFDLNLETEGPGTQCVLPPAQVAFVVEPCWVVDPGDRLFRHERAPPRSASSLCLAIGVMPMRI